MNVRVIIFIAFMQTIVKYLESAFQLSCYEAKLYVAALQLGQANVSELAMAAKLPRTAAYPPLKALVKMGLVSPIKEHGKHTRYVATEPKYLETLFNRKRLDLDEALRLMSITQHSGEEITFRYFEGSGGIEMAADIFLRESKTKLWKTFENAQLMQELSGQYRFGKYVEARVKKRIRARVLLSVDEPTEWMRTVMAESNKYLLEFQRVSHKTYPLEASVAVSGEWVLVAVAVRKPFALLIRNDALAKTIESIHDIIWERYSL